MSLFSEVLKTTPDEFESNRAKIMDTFEKESLEFKFYQEDADLASKLDEDFVDLDCLSKIRNLDSVTFIQLDIRDNNKALFGDISKAIEDAINIEIDDIMNINENNASRQATPNVLKESFNIKKKKIIEELIFGVNTEAYEQNMMTVRCMEIYSEMAQSVDAISVRSHKKLVENEKLLLFIGITPKPNKEISEAHLGEVISYTIAIVSNIKDGTIPDVADYKTRVVDAINNGINNVPNSENIKATIKSFGEVSNTLDDCKRQLESIPQARSFVNTISAIQEVCKHEASQINNLYDGFEK